MNLKKYIEIRKVEYWELSHGVVVKSNGVGPGFLNYFLPQFNFREAADVHDIMYSNVSKRKGEYLHIFSKEEADTVFLESMLKACKKYKGNTQKIAIFFAYIYYYAVHFFGTPFYDAWGTRLRIYAGKLFNIPKWQEN